MFTFSGDGDFAFGGIEEGWSLGTTFEVTADGYLPDVLTTEATDAPICIRELTLRRYEIRGGPIRVETRGSVLRLHRRTKANRHQTLFSEEEVLYRGLRDFGGTVMFPAPPADYIDRVAGKDVFIRACCLLDALVDLCLCARPPWDCDCCSRCEGRGEVSAPLGRSPCAECGGVGYGEIRPVW